MMRKLPARDWFWSFLGTEFDLTTVYNTAKA